MANWGGILEEYLKRFLDQILQNYGPGKIILHKAYMVDHYIDKNGERKSFSSPYIKNNSKINEMLQYIYDYTKNYFKKAKIIDLCGQYSADECHKCGLATMHYQKEYYEAAAEMIKKYAKL